ncbi:MAG: histidine phosphatase family protein [Shewanella sp.]
MKQVRLLLLRHGECEGGAILRGRVDVPLSQMGWQQMSAAVEAQASVCSAIYSSTSRRCADFADAFAQKLHSAAARVSVTQPLQAQCWSALQEIDFGDWDGCRLDELYQQQGERLAAYWQNPWQAPPPNGETMASFESRVNGAIDALLAAEFDRLGVDSYKTEKAEHEAPAQVWVVTHGGVIRHLMARALGLERAVGVYRQLDVPVAAVVTINVLQDDHGAYYWRLAWPSGAESHANL